ncbi:FT-interacting protein 3-like [Curcuma longa]|uniref:FT-interacting protein 3-like n=1 Tax=Curcuma longa TaxID=136217 RepID=UPI003D9FAEC4
MNNLKLGVEVVSAHDLMPKDGEGSSNPFVELHFDRQKFRTSIKEKDLNPVWNELFYFNIGDPSSLPDLTLEASVHSMNKATNSRSFLGKVQIAGTSFVPFSEAVVMHYPLGKHRMFSRVKGELALKVFLTDDPSIKSSNPLPAIDLRPNNLPPSQVHQEPEQISEGTKSLLKKEPEHTFRSIPNEVQLQQSSAPPEQISEGTKSLLKKEPEHTFRSIPNEVQLQQSSAPLIEPVRYVADPMKQESHPSKVVRMFPLPSSQQPVDYALKETSPLLGGGQIVRGRVIPAQKPASTYDLVEQMQYLFVRVVKARDLPTMDVTGSLDPYVEVRVGNYKGKTRHFEKNQNPVWNEAFAISRDRVQSSVIEVVVKDKDLIKDDFVGIVRFDLNDVPTRVPPDSPLAPEWYRLEDKKGDKTKGELMVAIWIGTQADEAFADAWHLDAAAAAAIDELAVSSHTKSKVYHAPRLWYLRVNVIDAQDIFIADKTRIPDVYAKVQLGNQILKTRPVQSRTFNPLWNEDLMFVAAEPFEDQLIISVEDRVGPNKDEVVGRIGIPLGSIEKRLDDHIINARWFSLEKPVVVDVDQLKEDKFSSKIHLRVCLEGGYHVLDESTHYSSDLRPTAKQLWKPSIGLLELGILNAEGLHPMKTRQGNGTCDTYCVAKYGRKWVRTRTVVDSLSPKYNEQYTWEVYDPATVLTVGVFDNWQLEKGTNGNKDAKIGKVRIRLSTLETGRVYTHSYPLLVLHPSGVKKMGELHLAIRFSSTSFINMMHIYSRPLLPKMHYIQPLNMIQQDMLRHQAVQIVAARLSRMEPSLRKEVVEYMSDVDSHMWSMRRSKANFFRLMSVFSGLLAASKWFASVCMWKNPITTVLVHILFIMLVCFPELILPTVFLYMFLIGLWNYRFRPRYPPHMNIKLSHAEAVHPDELDEEFDTFPTSRSDEIVRMRYDRLRSVAGRIQTVVGDLATQGERLQALLSWRDPRATAVFLMFCMASAIVLYTTPLQVLIALLGFYIMRHPRFRNRLPSAPLNFFRRLPAKIDSLL